MTYPCQTVFSVTIHPDDLETLAVYKDLLTQFDLQLQKQTVLPEYVHGTKILSPQYLKLIDETKVLDKTILPLLMNRIPAVREKKYELVVTSLKDDLSEKVLSLMIKET